MTIKISKRNITLEQQQATMFVPPAAKLVGEVTGQTKKNQNKGIINMMSTYRGLFVQKLSNGMIHGVQVEDPHGNTLPLEPDEYIRREIKPDINSLPDKEDYKKT